MPLRFEWSAFSDPAWSRNAISIDVDSANSLPHRVNLLSFLATAQASSIELLPITWTRQIIGFGGTSRLNEAYGNAQTSFAFKRIDDESKESDTPDLMYRTLTNEIHVLGNQAVRNHPYIIQLQGICWDPTEDGTVWPALVFEKAQFGDLYKFMSTPAGRAMTFEQRLSLCIQVEIALVDMHSMNIVHGDIKPQNILVFKDEQDKYRAKVTDFGYSSRYADDKHRIKLPISWPWNAPEHDRLGREWIPSQAKKVDVYSFGMICLWLLFEPQFCGRIPVNESVSLVLGQGEPSLVALSRNKKRLQRLGRQLIAAESEQIRYKAGALDDFFTKSLDADPTKRRLCLQELLSEHAPQRLSTKGSSSTQERVFSLPIEAFKIESSLFDFYRCDYRVRKQIARCLLDEHQTTPSPQLSHQVALCYELGFGVPRDANKAVEILQQSRLGSESVHKALQPLIAISGGPESKTLTSTFQDMSYMGHVDWANFALGYLQHGKLGEAALELEQDKRDLEAIFGPGSVIVATTVSNLCDIYAIEGKWKETERLCFTEIEACRQAQGEINASLRTLMSCILRTYREQALYQDAEEIALGIVEQTEWIWGKESPVTLESMSHLALIYSDQGRLKDAVELYLRILEQQTEQLGESHRSTLLTMNNLAVTYWQQGQWTKSLNMHTNVLEIEKRALKDEDPSVLTSMSNIAINHAKCGRWSEADALNTLVLEGRQQILGPEHPGTLVSMVNRAWIYREQGRLEDAAKLDLQVIETGKRVLGPEHPDQLTAMANLATTRWQQDRDDDCEQLTVQVLEARQRVLGPDHPDTLVSLSDMASIHWAKDRYDECEALELETLETRKRVLGENHPDTLVSISNLAHTYSAMGQLEKARNLLEQVLESREQVLGQEHPDTLSSMSDLASILRKSKKESEAVKLNDIVLKMRRSILGVDHADTVKSESFAESMES